MNFDHDQKIIWKASRNAQFPPVPNKDQMWIHLVKQMKILDSKIVPKQGSQNIFSFVKSNWFSFKPNFHYGIGLAFVLIFTIPFAYKFFSTKTIVTRSGKQQTLQLPDGSTVILNSESKVIYNNNFNNDHRNITLIGEAYFNVQKRDIPFSINTDFGQITVLGTIFNVRSREDGFEVGVNDGKVNVANTICSVELQKGEILQTKSIFTKNDLRNFQSIDYPGWINKKLYCNETKLIQLCSEIERTFNITIIISNPDLKNISVTGVIETSDLKTVLTTVSLLTQHEFKLEGDTVTII